MNGRNQGSRGWKQRNKLYEEEVEIEDVGRDIRRDRGKEEDGDEEG